MDYETLKKYGIDYEKGLNRFFFDRPLYEKVLDLFLKSTTLDDSIKAYDSQDYKKLYAFAHEIKGVSGNIEMPDLFQASSLLMDTLRSETPPKDKVDTYFEMYKKAYIRSQEGITIAKGS